MSAPTAVKSKDYWLTPEIISRSIFQTNPSVMCYELAPTGRVHAGIVRTLLYAEDIRRRAATNAKTCHLVLRLNDRAAQKGTRVDSLMVGAEIAANMPARTSTSLTAIQQLREDIDVCATRFGVRIEQIQLVSTLYKDPKFLGIVNHALERAEDIRRELCHRQTAPVTLFHPLCGRCQRMYCAVPTLESWVGKGVYRCRACGHRDVFNATSSEGLLAFKLESSMMWEYFDAKVDLHGQDHIEAFDASAALSSMLSYRTPLLGRTNLTFNSAGKKVSKSADNFVPVAELNEARCDELKARMVATPWSRPLRLPAGF